MAKQKVEENVDSIKVAAQNFFKSNRKNIYSEAEEPYKVSTGVFKLDYLLGGGVDSGTQIRLLGPPTSGKSSEGLLIIKNFIDSRPKCRGLIIPTEARLTEKLKARSGIPFVESPDQWQNKTCLILSMNNYEPIANFLWTLVKTNELKPKDERENFIIFVDCMDYLCLTNDLDKEFGETRKVAGPQYLTKMLWSKLSLPFHAGQHIFMATSQQSAAPKIDPYAKDPLRQGGSSGGTNIQYQSSTVIEFCPRYEGDYLLEDEKIKYDPKKNQKIGHKVTGWIRKSDNEKYDVKFDYCVKYGRTNGQSLWLERELADMLISWEMIKRENEDKGVFLLDKELHTELSKHFQDVPEKFRTSKYIYEWLEEQPKVHEYLLNKFKDVLA